MDSDTWNSLSRFQTHDLVRREFGRRHKRELSAARTWGITSCFVQAREYFASASTAAEAVRPLLLYYGVLSLSRGMILLLNPRTSEESLKPSHGLKTSDWKAVLSKQPTNVLDLEVVVEAGSFADLAAVTAGASPHIFPSPYGGVEVSWLDPRSYPEPGQTIRLDDLLSRIPRLQSTYEEVVEARAQVRMGSISRADMQVIVRVASDPMVGVADIDEIRGLFRVPQEVQIGLMPPGPGFEVPHFIYGLPHGEKEPLPVACPAIEDTNQALAGHLIVPWPNGVDVTALAKCYLAAYFLGMLVRYFPSKWMGLVHGHKGDAALPLLHAAMAHVEHDFPKLALQIL